MKRLTVVLFAVLFSISAVAAETQRYLVATRHAFRAGGVEAIRRTQLDPVVAEVTPYEAFDGFAADLTSSDVARLRASGEVRWVEPVVERSAQWIGHQTTPWGINGIHATQARLAVGQGVVNVVVVDTGIDGGHPELAAVFMGGWDFFTGKDVQVDEAGHGTHVAGTIAAADNGFGVVGVAPNVRLWAAKVLNSEGNGSSESVIGGIDWVVKKKQELGGNWIANLSLGSPTPSAAEREAFQRAADAGVLVFGASGNGSTPAIAEPVLYPAAYPSVHAVGATTPGLTRASFSNQGPQLEFAAPGTDVLSTRPRGERYAAYVKLADRIFVTNVLTGSKVDTVRGEYVYCGLGLATGDFPATVRGRIALIRRGEITFMEKARKAKAAGAVAVVIFDHEDEVRNWTLIGDEASKTEVWPVVIGLSRPDGEALAEKRTGTLEIGIEHNDYDEKSGTSMAAPHVTGAAAFLWSLAPAASPDAIVEIMRATASDLGPPGQDPEFGHGMIDLYAAALRLSPSSFPLPRTGRITTRRGGR